MAAVAVGRERLRAVFEEVEVVALRDPGDLTELHPAAEQMRDEDRPGAPRYRFREEITPHGTRLRIDIDRHRAQAVTLDDPDHVPDRDRRYQDLAPPRQREASENKIESRAHGESRQCAVLRRPQFLDPGLDGFAVLLEKTRHQPAEQVGPPYVEFFSRQH